MSTRHLFFAVVFLASFAVSDTHAQRDTTATRTIIEVKDGSSYTGLIVQKDDEQLQIRTLSGALITISHSEVRRIEHVVGEVVEGRWRAYDPNQTRLLFAPTARPLTAGRGYFALYEIFFPFVAYGPGAGVSLAGGVTLVPFLWEQGVYIAPKVTVVNGQNFDAAVGMFYLTTTRFEGSVGVVYGLATFGPPAGAATVGIGFGYDDGFSARPALMMGGEHQVSPRTKLLTENYYIPAEEDGILLTLALRTISRGLTADLGFATTPEALRGDGFPFVPLVNFMVSFGGHSAGSIASSD